MEAIETFEHKGFTIEIHWDQEPENPREDDNLGTMACFHPRYDLGDKHDWPMNREGYEAFMEFLQENEKTIIALPLYLYVHSGLRIKVGSFRGLLPQGHAEFDSGQVGWIYADKKTVRKEFKVWNEETVEKIKKILGGEVETYDQYLSGQIYGFILKGLDGEELDSCWGFYGMNDVINEAKSAAEAIYRQSMIQFELPFTEGEETNVELT